MFTLRSVYFLPLPPAFFLFFFFNDTATTEIYTLSLHDALPISPRPPRRSPACGCWPWWPGPDRKSTRLNSSHPSISYAVFCLKKTTQFFPARAMTDTGRIQEHDTPAPSEI